MQDWSVALLGSSYDGEYICDDKKPRRKGISQMGLGLDQIRYKTYFLVNALSMPQNYGIHYAAPCSTYSGLFCEAWDWKYPLQQLIFRFTICLQDISSVYNEWFEDRSGLILVCNGRLGEEIFYTQKCILDYQNSFS